MHGDDLPSAFAAFADEVVARAPATSRFCAALARRPELLEPLTAAPPLQRRPVLLLAALHDLLLADPSDPLARWYPDLTAHADEGDPTAPLVAFVHRNHRALAERCRTRTTQTNEIGRCAVALPLLAAVADEAGPVALVDVGCSAGLNLLLDQYHYDYGDHGYVLGRGGDDAPTLTCGVRGEIELPPAMPLIVARHGLDQAPIDVHDDERARWLVACIWPDQTDRLDRLRRAVDLARRESLDIRMGDAVDDLVPLISTAAAEGHPVVLNSWVLTYLEPADRSRYVAALDRIGRTTDLSWIILESPAMAPELPIPPSPDASDAPSSLTAVVLVRWRRGVRRVERWGVCHPHGYWFHVGR